MFPWSVWHLILEYANNWRLRGVCRRFRNFKYCFDIGDFMPLCKLGTIEILKQYLQQFPRQRFNIGSAVALRIDVVELFSTILPGVFWLEETFIRASASGNLPLAKLLCKKYKKAKYHKYDSLKEQALERACYYEQYEIINYLLKKTTATVSIIWDVCRSGNLKIIEFLISERLKYKLPISKEDYNYFAENACMNGHFKLVLYLMSLGADYCKKCNKYRDPIICPITQKNRGL